MKTSTREQTGVNSCLTAALVYSARGWGVIPLHTISGGSCSCHNSNCNKPGKHPRTEHGQKDASTDLETIQGWWKRWPDANVGIVTGALSRLVVLDVDPRHGGDVSLRDLEAQSGNLPSTVTSRTGGGGDHILFVHPGGQVKNRVSFLAGLDVRGDGGYIVAPPSLHASGQRYEWAVAPDSLPLSQIPEWLLELMRDPPPKSPEVDRHSSDNGRLYSHVAEAVVPEGARNATLTSLAGVLRRAGLGEDLLRPVLLVVNEERCEPPLAEDEVRAIAKSIARYPPDFPLDIGIVGSSRYVPSSDTTNNGLTSIVGSEVEYKFNAKALRDEALSTGLSTLPYLPLLGEDGYLVDGWSHLIAGYPKVGKTQFLVELCMSWATKRVLYITEEPRQLWEYRLSQFEEWESGTILCGMGLPQAQLLREMKDGDENVVVIDTLRLLGLKDENDNSALAAQLMPVIATCRMGGKTLILVHHVRKGGGERGEGIAGGHALLGLVDVALEIRPTANTPNRRLIHAYGRAGIGGQFLYEKSSDGRMVPVGRPSEVRLQEVKEKALDVLGEMNGELKTTSAILKEMKPPRPSSEQLRRALIELATDGEIQRDPPMSEEARGKTHQWRLAGAIEMGPRG